MSRKINNLIIIIQIFVCYNLHAHKDGHKSKESIKSIGVLTGTIIDSLSSEPLKYASISLIDIDHNELVTGGLSDERGNVYINEIPEGYYIALIEFIGYESKEISPIILENEDMNIAPKHHLGEVRLGISALNMGQVNVEGQQSQLIQTINKSIFNVEKNMLSSGGTGTEVLAQIPGVNVDIDGIVSISGDENVSILINGKKSGKIGSDRRSEVDKIEASMIDKVEVITNPSAKYDPDGVAGIINIITKRGSQNVTSINTSLMLGEREKQDINFNVNYGKVKWNLFLNGNYRKDHKIGDGYRNFSYMRSNKIDSVYQLTRRTEIPENLSLQLDLDYYPYDYQTITYTIDFSNHKDITDQKFNYILNTIDTSKVGNFNSKRFDDGLHIDQIISYNNNFNSPEKNLKSYISYSYEFDDVKEDGELENIYNFDEQTNSSENNRNFTLALDYENRFNSQLSYELGFKSIIRDYKTDLIYYDDKYSNYFKEDIHSWYFSSNLDISQKLKLKFGLRTELADTRLKIKKDTPNEPSNIITHLIDLAITDSPYTLNYVKHYPNFYVLNKFNASQTFQLGYLKRINRPERIDLNPFPQSTQDFSRIRNGNPYIEPEFSDIIEFTTLTNKNKYTIRSSFSYKNTKNIIMLWNRDYVPFNSEIYEVITTDNSGKSKTLNFNGTLNYRPNNSTSLSLWSYAWNSEIVDKINTNLDGKESGLGYGARLTLMIIDKIKLEWSLAGRSRVNLTYGHIPAYYRSDLGLKKSFSKNKLSISLKVSDLFDTGKFTLHTKTSVNTIDSLQQYVQLMEAERQIDKRFISLSFNYNFGTVKKLSTGDKNFYQSKEQPLDMDY